MTVRVVTDGSSDIPTNIADELDITMVPLYIRFGYDTYRDGIDIRADEFSTSLAHDRIRPQTSTPSPGDYALEHVLS
jgi:fatty acid-binding protein DegV